MTQVGVSEVGMSASQKHEVPLVAKFMQHIAPIDVCDDEPHVIYVYIRVGAPRACLLAGARGSREFSAATCRLSFCCLRTWTFPRGRVDTLAE